MGLLWVNTISMQFGGPQLLDEATLQVEAGERIGLLGRNGSGKSTFLKILAGELLPDSGEIVRSEKITTSILPQNVPDDLPGTVYDVVASGGREHVELLKEYHDLTSSLSAESDGGLLSKLTDIQHLIEASGAWHFHQRVKTIIDRVALDDRAPFRLLSAGTKRRVFLARALVNDPELLLLDEPTNHLDVESILWIEDFLLKYDKTIIFVTHDREFLRRLATRIVEIDRGRLIPYDCRYETYLERKQAMLEAQEKHWSEFDKKLAGEEVWIRKGIRARRTRNEGRVRALEEMRRERAHRREQPGHARMVIQEAERSGKMVIDAEEVSFSWGDKTILKGFSTTIIRGDRVGIIGPNGSGKTTLLKVLLGNLKPGEGTVRLGTGINVAYFDQLREQLDENKTLRENIGGGNDTVIVGSSPRHVMGYLQDFLFTPDRIMSPVSSLSGGERNRLLLAKLFMMPSNVLILDEPTNDLDAETLELFEERLFEYTGTILMVSHDRRFLNNVVTSTIVLEGNGRLEEYVGGYDDWVRQKKAAAGQSGPAVAKESRPKKEKPRQDKKKLSFKETRELEALPQTIEAMEEEKQHLIETINSPDFYVGHDLAKIQAANDRLDALEKELDAAYHRWDELESLAAQFSGN